MIDVVLRPSRPFSSAPQKANRTCRCSFLVYLTRHLLGDLQDGRVPLPLSLMPGPSSHRVEVGADDDGLALDLALGESAITLTVVRFRSISVEAKTCAVTDRPGLCLRHTAPRHPRS